MLLFFSTLLTSVCYTWALCPDKLVIFLSYAMRKYFWNIIEIWTERREVRYLPVESAPFFIPSTSFCSLLVHLILRASPNRSPHLRSHHLSLPRPFTHLFHENHFLRQSFWFLLDCLHGSWTYRPTRLCGDWLIVIVSSIFIGPLYIFFVFGCVCY